MSQHKNAPLRAKSRTENTVAAAKAKPGSKSPKHRGHRPDEVSALPAKGKKPRWSSDKRAASGLAPERPRGGARAERTDRFDRTDRIERADRSARMGGAERAGRPERTDRRPDWIPESERPAARRRATASGYQDRGVSAPSARNRGEGSRRGDEAPRFRGDDRSQRPARSYDDRPVRRDARTQSASKVASEQHERFTPADDVVLARLEAEAITAEAVEGVTFADLGLGGNITKALAELGATSPFPIQAATIPVALSGRDVLGRGRTGSGKTIAFGAPLVERLMENGGGRNRKPGRSPRALILAPTRELALQIDRTVQPIARSVGLFTTQVYGGVPYHRQVGALQRGVDIVIGTPGRIEDLVASGRLDLSQVTITVLDEADHMCELGFLEPVQRIIRETAAEGQKLLFSATLDSGVASLVDEFLVEPAVHEVAGEDQASSTIDHRVLLIDQREKREVVAALASGAGKTLVFTRTRAFAEDLSDFLEDAGIASVSLHGDLNQSRRTRNLEKLTSGRVRVLVATDVAARGIHVDDIALVVQADAPDEYKTYLHRSGRTGRAGKHGTVVTLVPRNRRRKMDELLARAEIKAEVTPVAVGDELLGELAGL